ncbi:MAG: ComEA family DNA-binding protein [Eubacterium sp.]
MKNSKSQTLAMIGISFLVIAGVIIAISLSLPKVYENTGEQTAVESSLPSVISSSVVTSSSDNGAITDADGGNAVSVTYPLNLNTASVEELMTINGLGETRAGLIVAYRQQIGSYSDVSQIKDIKGIGDSIYAQVAPYLTV